MSEVRKFAHNTLITAGSKPRCSYMERTGQYTVRQCPNDATAYFAGKYYCDTHAPGPVAPGSPLT